MHKHNLTRPGCVRFVSVLRKMIRTTIALGSGVLMAATPVKLAEVADTMPTVYLKKPSELPLYAPLHETDP